MNIGSLASTTALGRGHIAYSMAMGAVVQMTRELSTEWCHRGVRVNCVTPAQVVNPSLTARMAEDPTLEGRFLRGIPVGRLGRPEDIMGLAVLLASDASEWITGARHAGTPVVRRSAISVGRGEVAAHVAVQ
jgi:NAD(P)-dependent dehydrogenase (short-subunit alcohol dehydrogenase family)